MRVILPTRRKTKVKQNNHFKHQFQLGIILTKIIINLYILIIILFIFYNLPCAHDVELFY